MICPSCVSVHALPGGTTPGSCESCSQDTLISGYKLCPNCSKKTKRCESCGKNAGNGKVPSGKKTAPVPAAKAGKKKTPTATAGPQTLAEALSMSLKLRGNAHQAAQLNDCSVQERAVAAARVIAAKSMDLLVEAIQQKAGLAQHKVSRGTGEIVEAAQALSEAADCLRIAQDIVLALMASEVPPSVSAF
jgi:hypothetical protein